MQEKKKPLISIVVPVYNDEPFLDECLSSIVNQKYQNLEIILVDDGSTDKSSKILDEYAKLDQRIQVFHKDNSGVSDTRNYGLDRASGEYICFSDADDILSRDYVSYLYNLICKNRSADISLTNKLFSTFDKKQVKKINENVISGMEAANQILTYKIPIGVYSKLFRTSFLKKYGIKFDTELFIGEGFNYNIDSFLNAKKIIVSNKKIYFYRRNNKTSATTKFSVEKWENGLFAIKKIKLKIEKIPSKELLMSWKFAWWRTNSDAYDAIVLARKQKQYPIFFKKVKITVKKLSYIAWKVPTTKENKLRATLMKVFPQTIPFLLKVRRNIF